MPTIAESARIPAGLAAFRSLLEKAARETVDAPLDLSREAWEERKRAQAHVASRPTRPDKRDVAMSRIWDNYVAFERLIAERPMHARGKHNGSKPWNLKGPRTQAAGGAGAAGRSPGEHVVATRDSKIEW